MGRTPETPESTDGLTIDRRALLGELRELVGKVIAVVELLEHEMERPHE